MAYYDENEWQEPWAWSDDYAYSSYQPQPAQTVVTQVTTKIPPSFDGRTSWFAYAEAIEDWCDLTERDHDNKALLYGIVSKERPQFTSPYWIETCYVIQRVEYYTSSIH